MRRPLAALLVAWPWLALAPALAEQTSYSPDADRPHPSRVYWGDTHVHSSFSADANMFGTLRLLPSDAFAFARGEAVVADNGMTARMDRPLDFLVVSDHAEYLGLLRRVRAGDPAMLAQPAARRWYEMLQAGGEQAMQAFYEVARSMASGPDQPRLLEVPEGEESPWQQVVRSADEANAPGAFTAFIGFEWTSQPDGNNLHRVVVFRDGGERAGRVLPFSAFDSQDPRELWRTLDAYEKTSGGRVLAIPHNSNVSGGLMFTETDFDGEAMTRDEAARRLRFEPLVEITQIKGDSETHPLLSPNDEFADFGRWDKLNLGMSEKQTPAMLPHEYLRSALALGLRLDAKLGINPYRFGLIGATDSHTGLASAAEDNFWGKFAKDEPSPQRASGLFVDNTAVATIHSWESQAAGYAGVWALANTREAIFDAMERREVYATTGPRMRVRLFGGWDYAEQDAVRPDAARIGYAKGVPIGAELEPPPRKGVAPAFLVTALMDPEGARLDRVQIVKGWLEPDGDTLHERVYDVVWSGERKPGADAKLPPVGITVDLERATWTNTIGAAQLATVWRDPDFDPRERAFYYARV
ncbi:MAG: DUF3604 domain-containing protein, partial [Myxococcales bacterium]